jgi:hypothetical protein
MTDQNWVTGEAILWLDNDETSYHEARKVAKRAMRDNVRRPAYMTELALILRAAVPGNDYGVIEQFADIDWPAVMDHLIDDIEEGYE